MKRPTKLSGLLLLSSLFVATGAKAANVTLTITFSSPAATSITFTPTAPCTFTPPTTIDCPEPMAAGAQMGTLVVAPLGWSGTLTGSGTTAILVQGTSPNFTLNVGATAIQQPESVTINLVAAP